MAVGALTACGAFGGSDSGSNGGAPPSTPDQNAQPPIPGDPIVGIFVSAHGTPDGDGTMGKPVNTITAGIALGKASNQRVVVCAEEYTESLDLADGVSIYGYFDCRDPAKWVQVEKHAVVKSPSVPALHAANLTQPTRVEGFDITAADATGSDASHMSSIGALVVNSPSLTISKSTVTAGNGKGGTDGVESDGNLDKTTKHNGTDGTAQLIIDCTGGAASCGVIPGPQGGTSSCTFGASGGAGGQGGFGQWWLNGSPNSGFGVDTHGLPKIASGVTNAGGPGVTAAGADATKGADGQNGADGTEGTNGQWTFDLDGTFHAGDGKLGTDGQPGQGGGGGGAADSWMCGGGPCSPGGNPTWYRTATGGGGGAGGCGGTASTVAATGGGASVAALILGGGVQLPDVQLIGGVGGRGGKGTKGAQGNSGGAGGAGQNRANGAPGASAVGGTGGKGGWGGFGGHGAPGPSIGLVWSVARPLTSGTTTLTPGLPAEGQQPITKITATGAKNLPPVSGQILAEYEIKAP